MLRHVLVVDDQPSVCVFIQTALTGIETRRVSIASSEDAARSLMSLDRPDLVLIDATSTDAGGLDLAFETAARDIPFLAMTDVPPVAAWLEEAGWPHLRKPFTLEELLRGTRQAVREAREVRRFVAASVQMSKSIRAECARERQRSVELLRVANGLCGVWQGSAGSPPSPAEMTVVHAAEAWARAMEAIKEADEERRFDGHEEGVLDHAESALYDAVLKLRRWRRSWQPR